MKIFWKAYAILFFFMTWGHSLQIFGHNSSERLYYMTTLAFSPWFIVPYLLAILSAIFELVASAIVTGYAWSTPCPTMLVTAFRYLFYIRIAAALTGHNYEWKFVQSAFVQGHYWGWIALAWLVLPVLPSYLAHYCYAFNQEETKAKTP